jgi:hypothetical protein
VSGAGFTLHPFGQRRALSPDLFAADGIGYFLEAVEKLFAPPRIARSPRTNGATDGQVPRIGVVKSGADELVIYHLEFHQVGQAKSSISLVPWR